MTPLLPFRAAFLGALLGVPGAGGLIVGRWKPAEARQDEEQGPAFEPVALGSETSVEEKRVRCQVSTDNIVIGWHCDQGVGQLWYPAKPKGSWPGKNSRFWNGMRVGGPFSQVLTEQYANFKNRSKKMAVVLSHADMPPSNDLADSVMATPGLEDHVFLWLVPTMWIDTKRWKIDEGTATVSLLDPGCKGSKAQLCEDKARQLQAEVLEGRKGKRIAVTMIPYRDWDYEEDNGGEARIEAVYKKLAWGERSGIFWRGGCSGDGLRREVVRSLVGCKACDVKLTQNSWCEARARWQNLPADFWGTRYSAGDQKAKMGSAKAVMMIEGMTWPGNWNDAMMSGAAPVLIGSWATWIFEYMEPWRHYVPVKEDLSDLNATIDWILDPRNDQNLSRIGEAASALARESFRPEVAVNFVRKKLRQAYERLTA